jgi:aminotransferase
MSIPERLHNLPTSSIRRLFDLAGKYGDVISLGIGEPDFDTPQFIKDFAKDALDRGMTHYTPNNGLKLLRDAIALKLKRDNGIEADPDRNIIVTVGGNEAFLLSLSTFIRPGDEVIIPSPYFVTYSAIVSLLGGKVVEVGTSDENGFRLDGGDLRRVITGRTRCIMINSPNNPTGVVLERSDMEEIAAASMEHDIRIVSDEVYEALVYEDKRHTSIASLNGMADSVITINSFSKTFAMTGWRIGYAVADEETVAEMTKFQMYLAACPISFGQYAAAMALQDPRSGKAVEAMRSEYERRRDCIYSRLNAMGGISVVKPMGAFYIFPRLECSNKDDNALSASLLEKERVVAVPGSAFGTHGAGHLRMCYATSMESIEGAMDRLERFMARQ